MPRDGSPGSALGKAIAALEILLEDDTPLGPSDLAQRLGLPKQSAHRILRQLTDEGLIRREPVNDRVAPGPRLRALGLQVVTRRIQEAPRHAVLEALAARLGESCNIGILDGTEVLYLDRVECDWPLRLELKPGSRIALHCGAIGKVLMAHLPARSRRRLLDRLVLAPFTDRTITDRAALEEELRLVRRRGYATNDEENTTGLVGLAVPIRQPGGRVIAGLSVHAPVARMRIEDAERHVPALHKAAAEIGRTLVEESGVAEDAG